MGVLWTVIILIALAIAAAAAIVSTRRSRMRSAELQARFGPEYDRALREHGDPARAERELAARARRVEAFEFRELSPADRTRFESRWTSLQAQFVDDPRAAVLGANDLVNDVMSARGYPSRDFAQRVADLSVHHATMVQHYRAAHELTARLEAPGGAVSTEDLRQAVVLYRALFAELLGPARAEVRVLRESHA